MDVSKKRLRAKLPSVKVVIYWIRMPQGLVQALSVKKFQCSFTTH